MLIKITSCKDTSLWYNSKIGEVLKVHRIEPTAYWCREDDEYGCLNFVYKNDCIVVD